MREDGDLDHRVAVEVVRSTQLLDKPWRSVQQNSHQTGFSCEQLRMTNHVYEDGVAIDEDV